MKYKMIVSDFDNTLCNSEKIVTERTRNAIKEYTSHGGIFIICTTRPYGGIEKIAKDLGLSDQIICNQGASIRNLSDDSSLSLSTFSKEQVAEIIRFYNHLTPHIFIANDYIGKSKTDDMFMRLGESGMGYPLTKADNSLIEEAGTFDVSQILIGSYSTSIVKLFYVLGKKEFSKKYAVGLCDKYLINFVPNGCSKGRAIEKISRVHGIDKKDIVAFGDSRSDYPMFQFSGTGVAMGNANSFLKQQADYICADCENDGVADFIEKYCLD